MISIAAAVFVEDRLISVQVTPCGLAQGENLVKAPIDAEGDVHYVILSAGGKLTPLGRAYKNTPQDDEEYGEWEE